MIISNVCSSKVSITCSMGNFVQKIKLDLPVVLPANRDCQPCTERLLESLRQRDGVFEAHLDHSGGQAAQLCLHYDPGLLTMAAVEQQAREVGIGVQQRYRHRELTIEGMDCADCALKLERGVGQLNGVLHATVNFTAGKMWVEYDTDAIDQGLIAGRIHRLGYGVKEEGRGAVRLHAILHHLYLFFKYVRIILRYIFFFHW